MKSLLTFISLLLIVELVGCTPTNSTNTSTTPKETAFKNLFATDDVNQSLKLKLETAATEKTSFGTTYNIRIENASSNQIGLSYDLGNRIFAYSEATQQWADIRNKYTYIPGADVILEPKNNGGVINWLALGSITPDLTGITQKVTIRVVFSGRINNLPDKLVIGYLDIETEP